MEIRITTLVWLFAFLATASYAQENPVEFLIDLLDKCRTYRSGECHPPLLLQQKHIESLFDSMDPMKSGFIDEEQYHTGASDEVRAEVGLPVSLPCRVDTAQCGELHSVKWYRDNHRVYVFSHVANIRRPEGDGSDRMEVEYTPNSSVSRLHIKEVMVEDEALYKCEQTYLEVRENCDVVQVMKLRTMVRPQSVRILGRDGSALGNATVLGPFNEGTELELECEAAGAKPVPQITWYNGSAIMKGVYTNEADNHGMGTARSKLRIELQRGDLFAEFRCIVESDALDNPIVAWLKAEVNVPPTHMDLSGVKSHVVQDSNVLLTCKVYGARPAANVTWYNSTDLISPEMVSTSTVLADDGTYTTESELIFVASRFENGQTLTCKAENTVLREKNSRPLHESLKLEVLYPPIVNIGADNITVNETQEILIKCNYVANPAKLDWTKWYKNGQVINIDDERYEGGTTTKPSLKIKSASKDDIGDYHCQLKNSVGAQDSWNFASVNVFYKPSVELRMEPSNIVKAVDRINVTLLCDVVSGNPDTLLRVQWYLGGDLLKELPDENCTNDVNSDRTFCDLDPSRLLLEYVAQNFAGNYSCRGMNDAGWGPISDETELIVYYPPSQALVRFEPSRVLKKGSVTLYCNVDEPGRPEETKYMWLRGSHVVRNATSSKWTISPVTFETNSTFTCIAYNDGGQGPPGTVNIEVLAPPAFIAPMQPYTGTLMNAEHINISCRVECSPMCNITWLKGGQEIEMPNDRYWVTNTIFPPDNRRYDFESVQSILHWNMSAWPNGQLDRFADSANYTCRSSSNGVGPPVKSTTLFGVEYSPENITVSNKVISVIEHQIPQRVTCTAKGAPEVSYMWYRSTNMQEPVSKGNALILGAVTRSSTSNYVCKAFNKHGNITDKTRLNVMFKPECVITQTEHHGNPALVCSAQANPREVTFTWRVKGMNETPDDMRSIEQHSFKSYLILDTSIDTFRTYVCYANNTVDISVPCERDVAGTIAWWKRLDNENLFIYIAIIVGIIVCVIIVCIIIIIVCRRKRANKYNNPVELEERENQYDLHTYRFLCTQNPDVLASQYGLTYNSPCNRLTYNHTVVTFKKINTPGSPQIEPTTVSRKRKKPGQVPSPSNTADKNGNPTGNTTTDPHTDPENKTFYENLPFHGMQNPPNKPVSIITPFIQENSLQNSTSNLNISTKSLVHQPNNPFSSPVVSHTSKIQRNQSFHGFQLSSRFSSEFSTNNIRPSAHFPNRNASCYPIFQNHSMSNWPTFQNMSWSNHIYGSHPASTTRPIGPLILAQNIRRLPRNSARNFGSPSKTFNFNLSNMQRPQFTSRFSLASQQSRFANPFMLSPDKRNERRESSRIVPSQINSQNNTTGTLNVGNFKNVSSPCSVVSNIQANDNVVIKTNDGNRREKEEEEGEEVTTSKQQQPNTLNRKHGMRCSKKFGSFEYRKHKCNSPIFYSVRCRKHGKKRTVFELYALPLKHKSSKAGGGGVKAPPDAKHDEKSSVTDIKTNCVVVSEIPKYPKENDAKNPEIDEALYQNLTDSIQILEQNSENNIYEIIQNRPKPAPRCSKKSPSNIYQNMAFLLKVTPEKNQNECNARKEDQDQIENDKSQKNELQTQKTSSTDTNSNTNSEINTSNLKLDSKPKVPLKKPIRNRIKKPKADSEKTVTVTENSNAIDENKTMKSEMTVSSPPAIPSKPKTDFVKTTTELKRPVPIKPKDFSNPSLIPKMPILDTRSKWNTKSLANKNPFYTLTTPQLTSSHQQQFTSADQLYSSTYPHQRSTTKLVPRALFPEQQQIAKSKSFSSRSKQKKTFQIPLQKCHSFKFQTAESYFQPIKNIHEENLMRNGGYQSDYGANYSRHKSSSSGNSATLRRSSDTQKYRENLQFHENIQNSVQLQYPQPLYAAHNTSSGGIKKNGVVYADLDMDSAKDKKRSTSTDEMKRNQKTNKTEYATLKFNDVGQEIDV